jgi:endoglycosylceramidase
MRRVATVVAGTVVLGAAVLTAAALTSPARGSVTPKQVSAAALVHQTGQVLLDAQGRVVVLHGLNEVFKVPPYEPAASGFSDDDAAFLQANGFNAMRVGVIWAAVEPQPGVYDDAYLASIQQTVQTLAAHGIVSVLDFHQDLYNETFQGEGAPAWAVLDHGLPNPALGFPGNYFANPAEDAAWDSFFANAKAADGVGLQDHYARAWAHVAAMFGNQPGVFGYELLNEPWPGTAWEACAVPLAGCPAQDMQLTKFYQRVARAIRAVDPSTTMWVEPNVLFSYVDTTQLGRVNSPDVGFAFHDYCGPQAIGLGSATCKPLDDLSISAAKTYAGKHHLPLLLTEWGATTDLTNLTEVRDLADHFQLSWLEWAYTGNDKTSASPNGQALVFDPTLPPTGSNVDTSKLAVLAEPYPQAVAGTPTSWQFRNGVFTLTYATTRAGGSGRFPAGSTTQVAVPAIQYPAGYTVAVSGGTVTSAAGATVLLVASAAGAKTITVTVSPA